MALDPEKKDRSYQFGRLLAVLEKAEWDTYEQAEKRETNAIRLQPLYIKRPLFTQEKILKQLKNAYYQRLSVGTRIFYERLIGDIMVQISECPGGEKDSPLNETYLLGYYLQKNALYASNKKESEENEQ